MAWRRGLGNIRETSLREIWASSLELARVRRDNEAARKFHVDHQDKIGGIVYCPGRAEQESGSPFTLYEDAVTMSVAVRAANPSEEEVS